MYQLCDNLFHGLVVSSMAYKYIPEVLSVMNRRQFFRAASAVATAVRGLAAKKYDLIVKGGRVIDPSRKLDAIRDVAIAEGRIAAVAANIPAGAAETIDASGKLVVPGL